MDDRKLDYTLIIVQATACGAGGCAVLRMLIDAGAHRQPIVILLGLLVLLWSVMWFARAWYHYRRGSAWAFPETHPSEEKLKAMDTAMNALPALVALAERAADRPCGNPSASTYPNCGRCESCEARRILGRERKETSDGI